MGVGEYILALKINHAKYLLENTFLKVNEIATRCGFNDITILRKYLDIKLLYLHHNIERKIDTAYICGVFLYNVEYYTKKEALVMYQRVRDMREDHDKTQRDIAEMLNMHLTVYQRYERGERELPLWAAIKLANYYKVTLDYLVGRTN